MQPMELIEAVKSGDDKTVARLVENGADLNEKSEQGWSALSFAAGKGNLQIVKLLIQSGANIAHVGRDKRTAYMIALAAGHIEVAQFLKSREMEGGRDGQSSVPERKYCMAYALGDLRKFPLWMEGLTAGDEERSDRSAGGLSDESIVFLHQDFTVSESIWNGEKLIFRTENPAWREYCSSVLNFKVPSDIDLASPLAGL